MRDHDVSSVSIVERQPQAFEHVRSGEGVTVVDIITSLLAHRWLIATCGVLGVLLTAAYIGLRPAVYAASALVRIDPARANSLSVTDRPVPMDSGPGETIHTETVLLKSDDVAIRALNTLSDKQFASFTGSERVREMMPQDVQRLSAHQQFWILKLEEALSVKQIDGTQLISVTVKNSDPSLAAALANDVVKAYTVQAFENRSHSVADLRGWLSSQMDELQTHVERSQQKLTDFEKANDVVGTAGTSNTIADRLRFLSERLSAVQSDRITKEAQMRAATNGSPVELAALFPSPKLTTLQAAQGTLYAQYAQLSTKFGPNYPPLADITKQMQRIDVEIAASVQPVRERLSTEYLSAKRAQDLMQNEYDKQIALAYKFDRNHATYSVLQGDVAASRELYDALRRKLQQATVDAEVSGLNTVLVQGARVPLMPAGPGRALILSSSLVLSLFAGVLVAFVSEMASGQVHGAQQIERELGLPVIAHVSGERRTKARLRRSLLELDAPLSKASEGIRTLRNSVILTPHTKSLLVTSARDGEGARRVAVNLAILLSNGGARTLLLDANLREPCLQVEFGIPNGPGIGEYLTGRSLNIEPVKPTSHMQNLFVVSAGNAADEACDLLSSIIFRSLLLGWRREFDYVVVISPPVLMDSVATLLASWVDATVLTVQSGHARVGELKQIRETFMRYNARIHGVVLSSLPSRIEQQDISAIRKETRYEYPTLVKQVQAAD